MNTEEIQAIFFAECEESLVAAEEGLAACKAGTQDDDTVNAVFRAVHSIKGGAGAFGYIALQAYTHVFETLLSDLRDGTVPITAPLLDLMLCALDTLSDHVNAARGRGDTPDDTALLAELTGAMAANAPQTSDDAGAETTSDFDFAAMLDDIAGAMSPDESCADAKGADKTGPDENGPDETWPDETWVAKVRPHAGAMGNGSEPLLMLREVIELGGICIDCDVSAVPALDTLDPGTGYLGWSFALPGEVTEAMVRDAFDFVGDECSLVTGEDTPLPPVQLPQPVMTHPRVQPIAPVAPVAPVGPQAAAATPAPQPAAAQPAAQSIRIELGKLDKLIDAVGELVIAQAMMAQRLASDGLVATEELTLMESLTRDIQETAMAIRAQPIGAVFSRVPRILRELTASTGKHVQLIVSGESTELDKTVIERLGEPLTHLIRNAVYHGIESADDRIAAGKPAHGTLTLSAEHKSGRILIRIGDDGRGIDRARVLAKAIEKGVIAADAVLSKEEIDLLIFAPGFSTAATITNVSGRGVGLDVVRQNVKRLGGRITIESEPGSGTTFTLTLPLTLAISDGMVVNVGDQTLVVPLANVVESLRPEPHEVKGLGAHRAMINLRGRFIPVVPLHLTVGAAGAIERPDLGVLIVVETESSGGAALLVDAICDQRQVVIKSLETHFRAVEGVAGATILGDGRVALIVDVDGLVTQSLAEAGLDAAGLAQAGLTGPVHSASNLAAAA